MTLLAERPTHAEPPAPTKTQTHYPGLDGLRGLAAFLVILHHTAVKGTDIGGLSVFLFFALSGFLITGILTRIRAKIEGGETIFREGLRAFWLQRALRIFPAYYFWLAVLLPFDYAWFGGQTWDQIGWYVVYLQNFLIAFVNHARQDFTHTWSLAVEQQYYVVFALLMLALPARAHARFFVATIAACLATIALLSMAGYEQLTLYVTPTTGFVFMAAGGLLSLAKPDALASFANPKMVIAALAMIALLTIYPMLDRAGFVHVPYVALVIGSTTALTALLAATLAAPYSRPVRWLERPTLKFLGKISYALYIIHLPIAHWAQETTTLADMGAPAGLTHDIAEFCIVMPLSLALSVLSWRFVESPFLRLKARMKRGAYPPTANCGRAISGYSASTIYGPPPTESREENSTKRSAVKRSGGK